MDQNKEMSMPELDLIKVGLNREVAGGGYVIRLNTDFEVLKSLM